MLPVVKGEKVTRSQILIYTLILVGVSLLLPLIKATGSVYLVSAIVLGLFPDLRCLARMEGSR